MKATELLAVLAGIGSSLMWLFILSIFMVAGWAFAYSLILGYILYMVLDSQPSKET